MDFFFSTPRHGRGPKYKYDPKDSVEADTSEGGDEGGKDIIPFDLGTGESKKTKVTDFEMIKVIGKGSFGRVLLGKHIPTGDVFAVKVLSKAAIVKQNEVKHIMYGSDTPSPLPIYFNKIYIYIYILFWKSRGPPLATSSFEVALHIK